MDIQQVIAPKPVPGNAQGVDKKTADVEAPAGNTEQSVVQTPAFLKLLQGIQNESAEMGLSTDGAALLPPESLQALHLLAQSEQGWQPQSALQHGAESLAAQALEVQSLLGQLQQVDSDGQNGWSEDELQSQRALLGLADRWMTQGAQPHRGIGQVVATVAAGVQEAAGAEVSALATTTQTAAAQAVATLAVAGQAVLEQVDERELASEGRLVLQGAWKLEDQQTQINPALQRVFGQIEQWAAAVAAAQPKQESRAETGVVGASEQAVLSAAGAGSGTRLMENAVREASQAQNAGQQDASTEAPVEDMRFWLQGKQQRAEVVLERDGMPVRVQVSIQGHEAQVRFVSDQAQTRDMLDAGLAQLRDMLADQGVTLASVLVQSEQSAQQHNSQGERDPSSAQPGQAQHAQIAVPQSAQQIPGRPRAGLDVYA